MIQLGFNSNGKVGVDVLCLGAHCDDIEIGCGGALLKMINNQQINAVKWVVFASNPTRKKEAIASAEVFLEDVPQKEIIVLDYRDALLGILFAIIIFWNTKFQNMMAI